MSEYQKPLPVISNPIVKEFYEGTKKHKLLVQHCDDCKKIVCYPATFCPHCWSENLSWSESSGKGKLYSFSVLMSNVSEAFEPDLPYVVGVVDLEEGARLLSNIVDCKPEDVHCDMDVEVVFRDVTEEFSLPLFKPVS